MGKGKLGVTVNVEEMKEKKKKNGAPNSRDKGMKWRKKKRSCNK